MSFNTTIASIRNGALLDHLTERLDDLTSAVNELQKSGSITLTLNMKPNQEGSVIISPTVKVKLPEQQPGDAIMFVSDGGLVRRDPRQMDMVDELDARRAGRRDLEG